MARPSAAQVIALLAAAALAGGCGSASKAPRTARSWGATVQRVGEAWLAGEVPRAYARRTAHTARKALERQRESLRSNPGPIENAAALGERLGALARGVGRAEIALAAGNRDGVAAALADVGAVTREVARWAPSGAGA